MLTEKDQRDHIGDALCPGECGGTGANARKVPRGGRTKEQILPLSLEMYCELLHSTTVGEYVSVVLSAVCVVICCNRNEIIIIWSNSAKCLILYSEPAKQYF